MKVTMKLTSDWIYGNEFGKRELFLHGRRVVEELGQFRDGRELILKLKETYSSTKLITYFYILKWSSKQLGEFHI